MRKTLVLLLCAVLASAASAVADVIDDEKSSTEARTPHHELREAVAKIRSYYSPGYDAIADYRLATAGRRPRLGILVGSPWVPTEDSESGAVVIAVTPGSPADEAGLLAGDVITSFNGEALIDESEPMNNVSMRASRRLVELSRDLEEGDRVTLEYQRDGATHRVDLIAREFESCPMTTDQLRDKVRGEVGRIVPSVHPGAGRWFLPRTWLDMELVALNPELGEYFGADSGVLVVRGPEENDTLGLQSGDVILRIGDREVKSPEHAMRILRSYEPEEKLILHIIRHGRSETLTGEVPESPIDFDFRWDFGGKRWLEDR